MTKAIRNVHVFNGNTLSEITNVVFENGYIMSVGPAIPFGSEVVDGRGMVLLPGKMNPKTKHFDIGVEAIEPGYHANFGLKEEHSNNMMTVWHHGVVE